MAVCAFLCFCRLFSTAEAAVYMFSMKRCPPGIWPSHKRYCVFFAKVVTTAEAAVPHCLGPSVTTGGLLGLEPIQAAAPRWSAPQWVWLGLNGDLRTVRAQPVMGNSLSNSWNWVLQQVCEPGGPHSCCTVLPPPPLEPVGSALEVKWNMWPVVLQVCSAMLRHE